MKKLLVLSAAALAAACTPAEPVTLSAAEQGELQEELNGRVAGQPVSCVRSSDIESNKSVGEGVILFEGRGNVVYVNRPAGGCPDLRFNRTLVTRTTTSQLCRGDIAQVVDLSNGTGFGGCALGDFVPYRRAN